MFAALQGPLITGPGVGGEGGRAIGGEDSWASEQTGRPRGLALALLWSRLLGCPELLPRLYRGDSSAHLACHAGRGQACSALHRARWALLGRVGAGSQERPGKWPHQSLAGPGAGGRQDESGVTCLLGEDGTERPQNQTSELVTRVVGNCEACTFLSAGEAGWRAGHLGDESGCGFGGGDPGGVGGARGWAVNCLDWWGAGRSRERS